MECEEFKELASSYVNHQLPQEKIQEIEEHLCICESCRSYLGEILDSPKESATEVLEEEKSSEEKDKIFIYAILVIAFLLFIFLLYLLLSYKS